MPHPDAAALIADHLTNGFPTEGNGNGPALLALPAFRTTGMPPHMAKAVNASTHAIAEAIITLLETRYQLTDKTPNPAPAITLTPNDVTITCQHCRQPLIITTGCTTLEALATVIGMITPTCPHNRRDGEP